MFVVVFEFVIKSTVTYLYIYCILIAKILFSVVGTWVTFSVKLGLCNEQTQVNYWEDETKYMSSTSCAVHHVKGTEETTKFYGWSNKISVV